MYEIFDWHRYGRLFLALSVLLRTESVYIVDCMCFTVYLAFRCPYWHDALFLLFVLISLTDTKWKI